MQGIQDRLARANERTSFGDMARYLPNDTNGTPHVLGFLTLDRHV